VVRFPSERSGDSGFSAAMEEFSEFIFVQRLVDQPLQGSQFTWSNSQKDQVWSKIARFLLSPKWEEHFTEVAQGRLPRILSPLKVDLKKWNEEVFSDVRKKKELMEGIRDLDCIDEGRGLVEEERIRKTYMTKELEKTLLF
jgi:hypothetical protein